MAAATRPRRAVKLTRRRAPDGTRLIEIEVLAHETGLSPEVVQRLVRLGLVEPVGGTAQAPLFARDAAARLARATRLRRDLGLNYAGAVLASELLARIEQLEERLRRYEPRTNRKR
jgi:DNA-binding transcriptional MerR regulator